jgi:hypothetical protein
MNLYAIIDLDDDGQPEALLVLDPELGFGGKPGDYWVAVPALAYPMRLSELIEEGATFYGMSDRPDAAAPSVLAADDSKRGRWRKFLRRLKRFAQSPAGKATVRIAKAYAKASGVPL